VRSDLITVLRTVRSNRGSHGSLLFSYKAVFEAKRTAKMSGSRFSWSDRTVRSGFQNLGVELGPLVKSYELSNEWTAEHLSPNTSDNTREVFASSFSGPNRKLNPSTRGGRTRVRIKSVTRTSQGKGETKILGVKRNVRVAFEEDEECGRGKKQAVEVAYVQTAEADSQPRRHQ